MGRKLKQLLELPILTCELNVFTTKICISACVGKSFAKCLSELSVLKILVEKMISLVIFDTSFIQMVKYSFLDEKIAYQSFYGALLTFSYFSSGKSSLFRHA